MAWQDSLPSVLVTQHSPLAHLPQSYIACQYINLNHEAVQELRGGSYSGCHQRHDEKENILEQHGGGRDRMYENSFIG